MAITHHRDLRVWQRATDLAVATHRLVDEFTPASRYSYGAQLRRAAVSVAANIAEGAARHHRGELLQFLYIARRSLAELQTLRIIAAGSRLPQPIASRSWTISSIIRREC